MLLKMFLCNIFIAKHEFDFVEMETYEERMKHLQNLAADLYWTNYQKIDFTRTEPVFYYEKESKMNDVTFYTEELEGMSWGDLKMKLQTNFVKDI